MLFKKILVGLLIVIPVSLFLVRASSQSAPPKAEKYVIGIPFQCGFFSIFFGTLSNIIWAKKQGKDPVVYWQKNCTYAQKGGHNGSVNEPWEYYFEPVSEQHYEPGDTIHASYGDPDGFGIPNGPGCYDEKFHKELKFAMHDAIEKYIRIKPVIREKIETFYQQHMQGKLVIGIHLRGTDKLLEARAHNPQQILDKIAEFTVQIRQICWFFVATDEERLLDLAKQKFGDRVISYNSRRSHNAIPVHYLPNKDGAIVGEEVLIEAQLLSRCKLFIHTRTNVATAVLFFNPHIKSIFIEN